MAHKDWCGKRCGDCCDVCYIDEMIPCNPDCEGLEKDSINIKTCVTLGCGEVFQLFGEEELLKSVGAEMTLEEAGNILIQKYGEKAFYPFDVK